MFPRFDYDPVRGGFEVILAEPGSLQWRLIDVGLEIGALPDTAEVRGIRTTSSRGGRYGFAESADLAAVIENGLLRIRSEVPPGDLFALGGPGAPAQLQGVELERWRMVASLELEVNGMGDCVIAANAGDFK
jgi:hypothetical protein